MKQIFLSFTMTIMSCVGFAQTSQPTFDIERPIDLSYEEAMNVIFGSFDESKIPSGILKERSMQILNWNNYIGKKNLRIRGNCTI